MNRKDIIRQIGADIDIPTQVVASVFDSLNTIVVGAIRSGEPVEIHGLFNLKVEAKPARMGRNPATGAAIEIAAKNVVKITPAKALSDAANN